MSERMCQKWVKRFHSGDFYVSDATRSEPHKEVDSEVVKSFIESNPHQNVRELAEILEIANQVFKSS